MPIPRRVYMQVSYCGGRGHQAGGWSPRVRGRVHGPAKAVRCVALKLRSVRQELPLSGSEHPQVSAHVWGDDACHPRDQRH